MEEEEEGVGRLGSLLPKYNQRRGLYRKEDLWVNKSLSTWVDDQTHYLIMLGIHVIFSFFSFIHYL